MIFYFWGHLDFLGILGSFFIAGSWDWRVISLVLFGKLYFEKGAIAIEKIWILLHIYSIIKFTLTRLAIGGTSEVPPDKFLHSF